MQSPFAIAFSQVAESLRQARPQAADTEKFWRSGDLSYKCWDVQKRMTAVLRSGRSLKKVLNCSRRIRKTSTTLVDCIEDLNKNEGPPIRFVAPTQKMLRNIVHPIIKMICADAPEDMKPIWKGADGYYLFPYKNTELHIAGANNGHEDDSRGVASRRCVVDEAQMIDKLKYLVDDVLMPQLLSTGGDLWMALTPPKTPIHECREYVEEAKQSNSYAEFNIYESEYPPEIIEQFCKEAGGPESTTWLREYMCQFVVDKNFSIVPEWKDEYVEEYVRDEFFKFYSQYEGMDISGGKKHKTSVLYGTYDFKKAKLYIEDETDLSAQQTTTRAVADAVKKKETDLWKEKKPRIRIADNSNLILIKDLGVEHAVHFQPTTKDTLDAMVNNIRLWVGSGKLIISPKCAQLIGCLKYGVWKDNRLDWEESAIYGHFDALAALMYLLRYIDTATNPIPPNYGLSSKDMFIQNQSKLSANAQAIGNALLGKKK